MQSIYVIKNANIMVYRNYTIILFKMQLKHQVFSSSAGIFSAHTEDSRVAATITHPSHAVCRGLRIGSFRPPGLLEFI